ncbi:hypothetical protein [Bacillus cereus]|uniref:hypothetical protein n=1 Tax=Bacillus cereus TaxID=1396 RepID=UPI000944185E|nr:hypothetical protein [Bacillus cereus]
MAETKKVEVTLVGIFCENADDGPGNELEIFGSLYTNIHSASPDGHLISSHPMWRVTRDNCVYIAEGNVLQIKNRQTVDLNEDEQLALGGYLKEYDPGRFPSDNINDDNMGNEAVWIKYSEINQNIRHYQVPFSNFGQRVSVEYTVHGSPSS